ncbi:MAG: glucose-1-phosphate cytidylyltransferase [Nitrosomonas sp.]|nr:MAG: glucose-1-phosphate cytidylyltransferase [Nitrosomonas sp.]
MQKPSETPVFILCGGLGTRLKEETEFRPKPMVPIGPYPMLWHIMHVYSSFGFKKFILCLGFKAEVIKAYFLNYPSLNSDFTINLKSNKVEVHTMAHQEDWEVTLVDTGQDTMTGARLCRAAEKYLDGNIEHAAVTYGDGLCDADLVDELLFHQKHGKIGTVLGVNPPSRFGEVQLDGNQVVEFSEKPDFSEKWINGGFFFFKRSFFQDYVTIDSDCVLERSPLVKLAKDSQLTMYRHSGFWACMDTQRDREHLNQLWNSGSPPWIARGVSQ